MQSPYIYFYDLNNYSLFKVTKYSNTHHIEKIGTVWDNKTVSVQYKKLIQKLSEIYSTVPLTSIENHHKSVKSF